VAHCSETLYAAFCVLTKRTIGCWDTCHSHTADKTVFTPVT